MSKFFQIGHFVLSGICFANVASASLVDKVEVDQTGKPVLMSHKDASYFCLLRGLRLPTARELAEDAGGIKVQDTRFPNLDVSSREVKSEGLGRLYLMKRLQSAGVGVLFYYDSHNYQYQDKPMLSVWSSTICPAGSDQCSDADISAYRFHNASGVISPSYPSDTAAAVCVR